jgi:hypothetical protein
MKGFETRKTASVKQKKPQQAKLVAVFAEKKAV